MSSETDNRRKLFSRGDLFWFLLLPLFMGVGYFGFRYFQNTNADPNLRLIAKFNDNFSVELKGIVFRSAVGKPGTRWWKPNGFDFPELKADTSMMGTTTTSQAVERVFLFEINDTSQTQPRFRIKRKTPGGVSSGSVTSYNGALLFHHCPVDESFFASNDFTVELATQGKQTIAHLTPEKTSTVATVSGMNLSFEVIDSADGKELKIVLEGPPRFFQLTMWAQLDCKVSLEDTKPPGSVSRGKHFSQDRDTGKFRWTFQKSDWTKIEITFIEYDRIAEFDGVSVFPGVITSPRVVEPRSAKE